MRNTGSEDAVANAIRKAERERRMQKAREQTAAAARAGRGKRVI